MQSLANIKLPKYWDKGISCGYLAFDELLGNMGESYGARPGSVFLLSAPPGTGKSRLSLTVGNAMVQNNKDFRCGYFSAEQSVVAAAVMGKTMGLEFNENFLATSETDWNRIVSDTMDNNLNMIIVDSFPMIHFEPDENGKHLDTKSKANAIKAFAETNGIFVVLINHANRKGERGGRNELLHLVDIAFTLRKVTGNDAYGNLNVVEFHGEKNRDGAIISRAFPFNGSWALDYPMELASSDGDSGGQNANRSLEDRKEERRQNLIQQISEHGGFLSREELDDGTFTMDGIAASGIITMLRDLVEQKILKAHTKSSGKRGRATITKWELLQHPVPKTEEIDEADSE
jgi:hypothetical protein